MAVNPETLSPGCYKSKMKPIWCPGCGDFGVLASITRSLSAMGLSRDEVAVVSGIGCSSRTPAYLSLYGFHAIHGRALPVATGLKVARPELTVLVTTGDGDGFSIGGNHFMHACRRNTDLTYIVMDNQVYGMTKGQASPTTDPDWEAGKLTPGGTGVNPFQPLRCDLRGALLQRRPAGNGRYHHRRRPPSRLRVHTDSQSLRHIQARTAWLAQAGASGTSGTNG